MEEVIVYGIKSSLLDSIEIKRSNVGVMDAISAEDFGKFPDGNLAESLARVSGVAIDRSNVEGQAIAVRGFGPEFNLVTLNGRQMPTVAGRNGGGRSFNFGDIASPGVSAVEVFKSTNSTLPSGGIGSTVNMVTTKPLMVEGTKQSYSISSVEDSTSEDGSTPIEAALLYATNQDRWGFSLSASYQERTNREEGTQESNWLSSDRLVGRVDPLNPAFENNNARPDGTVFYQEPSAYLIKDNDRERTNAQATFQYMFTESITATVDYTMSGVDFGSEGTTFGSWLGGWDTSSATIGKSGAFADVVVGNRGYDHSVTWGESESDNRSFGFNLIWDVSGSLQLELDAHDSSAELSGNIFDNRLGFSTDEKANITSVNGGKTGVNTFSYDKDFGPENMVGTSLSLNDQFQENEIQQVQLRGTWFSSGSGALKSVEFGVSTAKSEFLRQSRGANFGIDATGEAVDGFAATSAEWDDDLFVRTPLGNFMDSFSPDIGTDYYFEIDARAAAAAFASIYPGAVDNADTPATPCCDTFGPLDSDEYVREDMDSAYVQLNFESEMIGRPLNVTAGLRYERTDSQSTSNYAAPTNIRWDALAGLIAITESVNPETDFGDSSLLLPSLAMALAIDDNRVLRMSFSKSLARPSLKDLETQLSVGNTDFFTLTANGGNPRLKPLESKNFDVAFENYYAEGSYVAVNYFRKKIKNFITSETREQQPIADLRNPAFSENGLYAQACVRQWVDDGRPNFVGWPPGTMPDWAPWGSNAGVNGGDGYCVAQNAIWDQPWMTDQQHMGWVALAMEAGVDVSSGMPGNVCSTYWLCPPGYIDGKSSDPVALFDITQPANLETGTVSGFELSLQHLFEGTPFGMQANYTFVIGGAVEPDNYVIGDQFILPGFGNSGNLSGFFENEKHTFRVALNYRAETAQGFANYKQPVYVDSRYQIDASYQYRYNENFTVFLDAQNVTDEGTRLWVRSPEMLFLSQDHGPVYKFGFRANF